MSTNSEAMPAPDAAEATLSRRRQRLRMFFYVYHGNHRELTEAIAAVLHSSNHGTLWDFFNQGAMVHATAEITRLLHNFVASAATWVDLSRRFIEQEYAGTTFLQEYQDEVSTRFDANGPTLFVKGLRNFALHRELPLAAAHLTIRQHQQYDALVARHGPGHYAEADSAFVLYRDKLLAWSKWSAGAKAYLRNADERMGVVDVVNQHYDEYYAFYQWLDQRLCDHAPPE